MMTPIFLRRGAVDEGAVMIFKQQEYELVVSGLILGLTWGQRRLRTNVQLPLVHWIIAKVQFYSILNVLLWQREYFGQMCAFFFAFLGFFFWLYLFLSYSVVFIVTHRKIVYVVIIFKIILLLSLSFSVCIYP